MSIGIERRIIIKIIILLALLENECCTALQSVQNYQLLNKKGISKNAINKFEQCNVLLTGATGGIGKSIAYQFASSCGLRQLILTGRDYKKLDLVANECNNLIKSRNYTTIISTITCDLSDMEATRKLGDDIKIISASSIDVLIHAAGVSSRSRFIDTNTNVDQILMNVNFLSGAMISKLVVPDMMKNKFGMIAWISGIQGFVGIPYRTSLAASKFAIQGYCEALRAEVTTSGISVHVIAPGYVRTNSSKSAIMGDGSLYNKTDENTEKGADPMDVAIHVLNSMADGKLDIRVAVPFSAKLALWLKFCVPSLLRHLLKKRYLKES